MQPKTFAGLVSFLGVVSVACVQTVVAAPVLPGYLTDPTAVKGALAKDESYQTPEAFKYPYVSTSYVKPTVTPEEDVKVGVFVTDFESSRIRFLDDSHRFTAHLEYRVKDGESKLLALEDLKSGDAEFSLGKLPVGEYEMRVWAVDGKGRESHRVIHDFRVVAAADLAIAADKVYTMTAADLAAYGIRNDGDFEKIVYVGSNATEVVKEKRVGVPGYTVTVPLDPKTGKPPVKAYEKATVAYDEGYDKAAVEADAIATGLGLQRLLDEKAAAGYRKVVMLPGTYRVSWTNSVFVPSRMTLDLGRAVLKQNAFTGAKSCMVRLASVVDAHLVGGTLEGDYWTHDYKGSPNNSEWPAGVEIGGDSWYCSVEGVKIADITGYGACNGIRSDPRGGLDFFHERLPAFAPGGLDPKTGEVDPADAYRFTTDFKSLEKIAGKGRGRLQVSKYLGYQGCATRSWQATVAWYDAERKFISSETCWQYREMWIPARAAFIRVSVEAESADAAKEEGLSLTAFRIPVNCAVKECRFERCRCVGYAAAQLKNMLFEGNFFTTSGESAARCAFDAEDGWDQMQDAYFIRNVFRDNPFNNSILTCAGHNFILEKNEGDVYLWGRTHSPCVRDNDIRTATFHCDNRIRSGYARFENNRYGKELHLGVNDGQRRCDTWDYVLSGLDFVGGKDAFGIDVGLAGRMVGCTFRDMPAAIANAYACTFENCTDASTYLPFPNGRWFEVTVKDSKFSRLYGTNVWERCHFRNVKLDKIFYGAFTAKNCDFTDCAFTSFHKAGLVNLATCTLDNTTFLGGYWEAPSNFFFKDCTIRTGDAAPFMGIGVYGIGRIGFDGCTVSGKRCLLDVHDLRPIQMPNATPETNPDNLPAMIVVRGTKWQGEAKKVVVQADGRSGQLSPKKVTVFAKDNELPEGVAVAADVPPTWTVKWEAEGI